MVTKKIDDTTKQIIQKAWKSLKKQYYKDEQTGEYHWHDNETDTGILKDIDAVNALIEPYLLCPTSFVDPPFEETDIKKYLKNILDQFPNAENKTESRDYIGFSSKPYPYLDTEFDLVDSAASFIQLICNIFDICSLLKWSIQKTDENRLHDILNKAVDYLLLAKVDDEDGVRWQGAYKITNPPGKFANLFFTNCVSLSLFRLTNNQILIRKIGAERKENILLALKNVPVWIVKQYNENSKTFWMDAGKTMSQALGVQYAVEILYTLIDELSEKIKRICIDSLTNIVKRMQTLPDASAMQTDFFHAIPLKSGKMSYDDRGYIGSFLSVFSLAKNNDPDVLTDDFVQAGEILYKGVSEEWIDEPTNLWDDGRPLISFTQDALIGLVKYSLEGTVGEIRIRENDLRVAIKEALASNDIADLVYDKVIDRANKQIDRSLSNRIMKAVKK